MFNKILLSFVLCLVNSLHIMGQTNPTPQSIPYTQDFSTLPHTSTTYPDGWQGWRLANPPSTNFKLTPPTADQLLTASSTAATTTASVHNYNGKIGFLNTNLRDLSIVLALNTSGLSNIRFEYDMMTIRNPYNGGTNTRINEVILQYRIGTTGDFTNITGTSYQNNTTTQTTGTTPQNVQRISLSLPVACNNEAIVQLRLASKEVSGAGERPSFVIDNVLACAIPSSQATNFSSSAITQTTATVGWTRGNGSHVLVVARAVSAVNIDPANNVSYIADPAFGSGTQIGTGNFVVYNGTGSSVNLTNLTAGVTFHFAIYEYNTGSNCYNTAQLIGQLTTLPPPASTIFSPGDFAVLGLNSNITTCSTPYTSPYGNTYTTGDDELSFMNFKNIATGDTFFITDNGFERGVIGSNTWGEGEGVYQLVRTGGTINAGTVITIRLLGISPFIEFISPDNGWTMTKAPGFTGDIRMNTNGDQLFFMQGGSWINPAGDHNAIYIPGALLFAINTNNTWTAGLGSTSASTSGAGGTQNSGLPEELACFNIMPTVATDFLEYTGPVTLATKLNWIARINNPANWTNRANCNNYTRMHVGQTYPIDIISAPANGGWTGAKDDNWFDCANWNTLVVPNNNTDVQITALPGDKRAKIVHNAPFANLYGNIARARNLTLSGEKLEIIGNALNKLEVYGNLLINGTGELDMSDGNDTTPDGQLYLYGNWTNALTGNDFKQGNSTVHLLGAANQTISCGSGNEVFHNLIVNNSSIQGITLNDTATIKGELTLTNGRINAGSCDSTPATSPTLTMDAGSFYTGGGINSYINGVMIKIGNTAFVFPIGGNGFYTPLSMTAPSISATFSACYNRTNPLTTFGTAKADFVNDVNSCEFWHFNSDSNVSLTQVTLNLDSSRCAITSQLCKKVVRWSGTEWQSLGNNAETANSITSSTSSLRGPITWSSNLPSRLPNTATADAFTNIGFGTHATMKPNFPTNMSGGFLAFDSDSKGLVLPRVSNANRPSGVAGLLIYNTDANCIQIHNGTTWRCIEPSCGD